MFALIFGGQSSFPTIAMKLLLIIYLIGFLGSAPYSQALAQHGHYRGGHGSSHKGGSYKNKKTGDHYRKRK